MNELPPEMWCIILHKIPDRYRPFVRNVCRMFNDLLNLKQRTYTFPISKDTLVSLASQQTLTNIALTSQQTLTNISLTETDRVVTATGMFTIPADDTLVTLVATQTLTNMTLTAPVKENDDIHQIVRNGELNLLEYGRRYYGYKFRGQSLYLCTAAGAGHLNILKWMRNNFNIRFSDYMIMSATEKGNLHVLDWIHQVDRERSMGQAYITATINGKLEIIKWLHSKGIPWTSYIWGTAIVHGHLNILKWCFNNGLPWDLDVCKSYGLASQPKISRWLTENNCPCGGTLHRD